MNKQNKEKEVIPLGKKLVSYAVLFALACVLINWGVRLLLSVWQPLLFLIVLAILLIIGWRIRKNKDWR